MQKLEETGANNRITSRMNYTNGFRLPRFARNDNGYMGKQDYVYIMTNAKHTALYTGVTNDLKRRVWEHKEKFVEGFTKKYYVDMLMYYEVCENVESAIAREKQIKDGSRQKKIDLINSINSEWRDLYEGL